MTKKISSLILVSLFIATILAPQTTTATSEPTRETRLAQKVKAAVLELGVGQSTRVNVQLRNKTKLTGYISEIGDSSFVITDLKSAQPTEVSYPSVVQVKGNNLSTGAKVAIAVGIIVGVAITLYLVRGAFCDGC
jgi:hypothetical protein